MVFSLLVILSESADVLWKETDRKKVLQTNEKKDRIRQRGVVRQTNKTRGTNGQRGK